MKISLLFFGAILYVFTTVGQTKVQLDRLTKRLELIYQLDQQPRVELDSLELIYGPDFKEIKVQRSLMEKNDSMNILKVTSILDKYGWLSESKTSETANAALFLVIQHANLSYQLKYLSVLRQAVEKGQAKPWHYAYLLDRVKMRQGKFQIYGSQLYISTNGKSYFYPIADEPNVNMRRKRIHLGSLEEVALKSEFVYNLPSKDSLINKVIIMGFVIETDQRPINNVNIVSRHKILATTNVDGFYKVVTTKDIFKSKFLYSKDGYLISDPPLHDERKQVYELNIMLTSK